jgi:hypothetical protein
MEMLNSYAKVERSGNELKFEDMTLKQAIMGALYLAFTAAWYGMPFMRD